MGGYCELKSSKTILQSEVKTQHGWTSEENVSGITPWYFPNFSIGNLEHHENFFNGTRKKELRKRLPINTFRVTLKSFSK